MELFDYLNLAQRSLFRFEFLQDYKVDDEDSSDEGMQSWWDFVSLKTKSGILMQRVRLVTEPFTDYTETELKIHKKSKIFGDDIRIIKEDIFSGLKINKKDFWLIDDNIVLKMNYSNSGVYQGFEVIKENISDYIVVKDILLDNSVDL